MAFPICVDWSFLLEVPWRADGQHEAVHRYAGAGCSSACSGVGTMDSFDRVFLRKTTTEYAWFFSCFTVFLSFTLRGSFSTNNQGRIPFE